MIQLQMNYLKNQANKLKMEKNKNKVTHIY